MGSAESGTIPELNQSNSKGFMDLLGEGKDKNQTGELIWKTLKQNSFNRPVLNLPDANQFENMYMESGGDINVFFNKVQERISDLYISLSKQTLELMCDKKLTNTESKIYISEQILYTSITILKVIGMNSNFKYDSDIINRLNSLQFSMLGYMKAKYPRQSQNFVPGELMQEFKNFDFVQQPQNDILKHLRIYFGDSSENKLMLQVKKFINKLIHELNQKFPIFEQLLSQKVFIVTKEGKPYTVFNKIGRKIPENVDELNEQDEFSIDLKSPEIFRVIVKWVNDMEDYILHPEEEIKEKDHFKTVKITDGDVEFDYITPDEIEDKLETMESHLMIEKEEFQASLKTLKNYIQLFNHNLIKIISKADRKQKYVPKREAEIIKYSMFNKRLLSWTVIEKLMIVLKKLITTSQNLEKSFGIKLDLVKFNVTDLMRAMMIGNKFQILKVFMNLKTLEDAKIINILKIKNRLETPLNDAMIIFKMRDSFIICELQLILSDGNQSITDKLKNIETLNHFFYQIERSPYGVMAQLAALLSFKDNKTNFESKITFQTITELSMENCRKAHPEKVQTISIQKSPFICSQCTQFYGEYENQYYYQYCKECNQYQCIKCLIREGKYNEENLRFEAVKKKIQMVADKLSKEQEIYIRTNQSVLLKAATFANDKSNLSELGGILNLKSVKTPLRNIAKKKNIVTLKEIEKHLGKKNANSQNKKQYFCICKFEGVELYLTIMKNDDLNGIGYCFDYGMEKRKQIEYKHFDFLMFLGPLEASQTKDLNLKSNINIFRNFSMPNLCYKKNIKQMVGLEMKVTKTEHIIQICKVVLIVDIFLKETNSDSQSQYKKEFHYQSIEELRQGIPDLVQTNEVINLGNEGVNEEHLKYFERISFKARVKFVNLHNNRIKDAKILLSSLPNLETLIISKNYLQKIEFGMKLPNFRKLVASNNQLSNLQGIENIPNVSTLNLTNNYLVTFNQKQVCLPFLRILDLRYNMLNNFPSLTEKDYPKLSTLAFSGESYSGQTKPSFSLDLPYLHTLIIMSYNLESFSILNTSSLQILKLEELYCNTFSMTEARLLKQFTISTCYSNQEVQDETPDFLQKLLELQYDSLTSLNIDTAWRVRQFPVLQMPQLKYLRVANVAILNISNMQFSKLLNLQIIQLPENAIQELPHLSLPKLQRLLISSTGIREADKLASWVTPNLKQITINHFLPNTIIPSLKNLGLEIANLYLGNFQKDTVFESETIKTLELVTIDFTYLPPFIMPNLIEFRMVSCYNVELIDISKSKLDKMTSISFVNSIFNNNSKGIPVINFPSLEIINFVGCYLEDISNLSLSVLPSIKQINLEVNGFARVPPMNFPTLESLKFDSCGLTELSGLTQSVLPKLKTLTCINNKVESFPILKMPSLVEICMRSCGIKQIKNLSLSSLPALKKMDLMGENMIESLCLSTNLPLLEEIQFASRNIKNIEGLSSCKFNQLKVLNLSYAQLEEPRSLPKLLLPNLTSINLEKSNIDDISNLHHSDLPQLTEIILNYSKVYELPIMKFKKLQTIKYNSDVKDGRAEQLREQQEDSAEVEVENKEAVVDEKKQKKEEKKEEKKKKKQKRTRLYSIKNLQFCVLPELTSLQFQNNEIEYLPKMNFPNLKKMFLDGNNIKNLSDFKNSRLPVFELLNIYNNKITQLPIGKEVRPTSIYMNKAEVENFNQLAEFAPRVENFFYNEGKMPEVWPSMTFKNVKIFQLNMCGLKVIDQIFKNPFERVLQLSVSDNQIERVPKLVCPRLQKLHLNRNCIKDVKAFSKSEFPYAKMISLESNQVEDLVDWPFTTANEVFLSHNKFTDISFMSKYVYSGLKMLVIWDAKVVKVAKLNAPIMEKMYLNENCIESLEPMRGSHLPKLFLLQISKNRIKDLSPFNEMKLDSLRSIYMTDNKVVKLCRLNLPALTTLNLNQNPIENVDQFLKNPLKLAELSISLKDVEPLREQNIQKLKVHYAYFLFQSAYVEPAE